MILSKITYLKILTYYLVSPVLCSQLCSNSGTAFLPLVSTLDRELSDCQKRPAISVPRYFLFTCMELNHLF